MPRTPKTLLDEARAYLVTRKGSSKPVQDMLVMAMSPKLAIHALYEPVEGEPWDVPEAELQAAEYYGPWLPSENEIMRRIARLDKKGMLDYDHFPTRGLFNAKVPGRKRPIKVRGWSGEGYGYEPYKAPIMDLLDMQGYDRAYEAEIFK